MRPNPLFHSTQEIASNTTQFYCQVLLYNQLSIKLLYCFFSKWFLKLIKQIWDVSCYILKMLREGILVQIHFNLSTSATQAQHLFGVISEPIVPLASVTLLNFKYASRSHSNWRDLQHYSPPSFWVHTPGGTTRKWKIEGMTNLR